MNCPLNEAPGCFKSSLIDALEPGGRLYLPTNWMGFKHYFCPNAPSQSAEDVVHYWADSPAYHETCTLAKVLEFANATHHQKLLEAYDQALRGKN